MLTGAAGLDWFFTGANDKITDRHPVETFIQTSLSDPFTSTSSQGRRRGLFAPLEL
jgi:hypothetical protein